MPGPGQRFLAGTAVKPELKAGALAGSCPVTQQVPRFTASLAAGPADACWDFTGLGLRFPSQEVHQDCGL